jgi:exopolyphosphatase/guanosine-5'-triphosphate,3'-diphosphate pyrophosphatase
MERIAAIDLGSNAVRALIAEVENGRYEILKKLRQPLRLGEDVFTKGMIGSNKLKEAENLFHEMHEQFEKYKVQRVRALATSAMRDAKNSKDLQAIIQKEFGISIETIDGDTEAKLIHEAVSRELDLKDKLAVLIDIGGGSTEFTVSKNNKLIHCKSFNMGAVRLLEHQDVFTLSNAVTLQMIEIQEYLKEHIKNQKIDIVIGTGGNFRRLGKIKKKLTQKGSDEYVNLQDIVKVYNELIKMDHKERVKKFEMSDDRADVIVPAVFMIGHIVTMLKAEGIFLPDVGLKEGILLSMMK